MLTICSTICGKPFRSKLFLQPLCIYFHPVTLYFAVVEGIIWKPVHGTHEIATKNIVIDNGDK